MGLGLPLQSRVLLIPGYLGFPAPGDPIILRRRKGEPGGRAAF
jgi:hypothetical protein